jgi:hypothetical protein
MNKAAPALVFDKKTRGRRENINGSLLEFIPHKDAGQGQALKGE